MKQKLLLIAFMLATLFSAQAQTIVRGDMNGDNKLTLVDLTWLTDAMLSKPHTPITYEQQIAGSWRTISGDAILLNGDGTCTRGTASRFEFNPFEGMLFFYDSSDRLVEVQRVLQHTDSYIQIIAPGPSTEAVTYYGSAFFVSTITLNNTALDLKQGDTSQLTATVQPGTAINTGLTWSSSDTDVATVSSEGLVTAVKGGSATITCTARDGSGVSASCSVTVTQNVTSITLSETSLAMDLSSYSYQRLVVTVLPADANDRTYTWISSNSSVALVVADAIVASGVGTATITCTANDGSGVSATCEVRVVNSFVTSITLNKTSLELTEGSTETLTASTLPAGADDGSITWSSSNTSVATVSSAGVITAVSAGTATITAKANGGRNISTSCAVTVKAEDAHDAVDLGLSVKWANCNVGATSPDDYGEYFAWGETTSKSSYSTSSFFDSSYTKYNVSGGKTTLDLEDDAAHVNWGGDWRMPTDAEFTELRTKCTWTCTTQNGVNGYKVTGTNGNSIFLPAAGYRYDSSLNDAGSYGHYWSSSLYPNSSYYAYELRVFYSSDVNRKINNRSCGQSVRPVLSK